MFPAAVGLQDMRPRWHFWTSASLQHRCAKGVTISFFSLFCPPGSSSVPQSVQRWHPCCQVLIVSCDQNFGPSACVCVVPCESEAWQRQVSTCLCCSLHVTAVTRGHAAFQSLSPQGLSGIQCSSWNRVNPLQLPVACLGFLPNTVSVLRAVIVLKPCPDIRNPCCQVP